MTSDSIVLTIVLVIGNVATAFVILWFTTRELAKFRASTERIHAIDRDVESLKEKLEKFEQAKEPGA